MAPVLAHVIPGARLVTIPGGGHFVKEDAGNHLADEIVRFIRETPARPRTAHTITTFS